MISDDQKTVPPRPLPAPYEICEEVPSVSSYLAMRAKTGLAPKDPLSAKISLENTVWPVQVLRDGEIVGFGRVVGDGGIWFMITDVLVDPSCQNDGLGRYIVHHLSARFYRETKPGAYMMAVTVAPEFAYKSGARPIEENETAVCFWHSTTGLQG